MFGSFQPYLCLTQTYSRLFKRALSAVIDHDYCFTNQQWQKKAEENTAGYTNTLC